MENLQNLLNRLDVSLGKKKANTGNRIDFAELKALKEKSFLKLKEGKNNIVMITPEGAEDPFVFWGYHNNLQETAYWSTPCDEFNKQQNCTVCKVVEDLKNENHERNRHMWFPIRQQIEYYAPVVVVDSDATIAEGVKWLRLSKTVMSQLTEWLRNLEKDEKPFYSDDEPQKIIINYDKKAAPADQYKLDKKNFKGFKEEDLAKWRESLLPISTFILSKSQAEVTKIVDEYFARVATEAAPQDETTEDNSSTNNSVEGKLSFLKRQ